MGREAEKRGLPKQLPVMAALVESGVKNLNYGDADSVGFFQMRVGIWNQGAYKGFPEKPELQVKWFLDQAEAVKKQRIARGQSVTDPKQFGDWIADIERPAAQYRGRYAHAPRRGQRPARQGRGRARGRASRPPPRRRAAAAADAAASPPAAVAAAPARRRSPRSRRRRSTRAPPTGTAARPRRPASTAPGLVQWAYAKAGVQIPRVTDAQFAAGNGKPVDRDKLQAGDLVFFGTPGNIYHVGISMGGDKFLHAPKTGDVVKVASLNDSYFSQNFAGGRRFDEASGAAGAAAVPAAAAAARAGRAADRPEGRRGGAGRGRARRRRGQPRRTPACSWRSRPRRSGATRPCSS